MALATQRRLDEELGMAANVRHLFTFQYRAPYLDIGSENEMCWVFSGLSDQKPRPNGTEIAAIRWLAPDQLDRELDARPEIYTPWFKLEWPRVRQSLK